MNGKIVFGSKGGLLEGIRNIIFKILIWISLQIRYCPKWRKMNRHNDTWIKSINGMDKLRKIKVGNYTYGPLDCKIGGGENSYITIGNYCGIAEGVKFICGFGHNIKKFCHHPIIYYGVIKNRLKFSEEQKNKLFKLEGENGGEDKGPIIVDDDVWIGTGAIILSGVHIHQGVVIAAGAVVTKDIPPYAIAGGVPAKVIKYRFSKETINELLKINYKNIPIEVFRKIYEETVNEKFNPKDMVNKINITLHNL